MLKLLPRGLDGIVPPSCQAQFQDPATSVGSGCKERMNALSCGSRTSEHRVRKMQGAKDRGDDSTCVDLPPCTPSGATCLLLERSVVVRWRLRMLIRYLVCRILVLLSLVECASATTTVLDRYAGTFTASGTILLRDPTQIHIRYAATSLPHRKVQQVCLRGTCRADLIISRSVTVDLTWEAESGRVTGTYTGSRVGMAQLRGNADGRDFDLAIAWPKPLYGDTTANLRVTMITPDRIRIVVMDRVGVNGPVRATTDLTLMRR